MNHNICSHKSLNTHQSVDFLKWNVNELFAILIVLIIVVTAAVSNVFPAWNVFCHPMHPYEIAGSDMKELLFNFLVVSWINYCVFLLIHFNQSNFNLRSVEEINDYSKDDMKAGIYSSKHYQCINTVREVTSIEVSSFKIWIESNSKECLVSRVVNVISSHS